MKGQWTWEGEDSKWYFFDVLTSAALTAGSAAGEMHVDIVPFGFEDGEEHFGGFLLWIFSIHGRHP